MPSYPRRVDGTGKREHFVVVFRNHAPWFIARRATRLIDFGDGTFMLSWRWSKKGWQVS